MHLSGLRHSFLPDFATKKRRWSRANKTKILKNDWYLYRSSMVPKNEDADPILEGDIDRF